MTGQPVSALAVYSALPTVRVDEQEYPKVTQLILSMEMREAEGGLSSLELRVSNVASDPTGGAALAFEDDAILRLGAGIAVYAGDENGPQEIFRGVITGLEALFPSDDAPQLVVLAEDVLQQARMARRTRVRQNTTIASLARDVAGEAGLTPVVTGFTEDVGTQAQINESDLAFLRRILARNDGDLQVVGRELHVSPRVDVRRGELELQLHRNLYEARVTADLAHQTTEVTVTGWDAAQGQRVSGRSRGANLGPGAGRTGAQLLAASPLGERAHHIGHLAATTTADAQALADAAFDSRARRLMCIEGTAEGNPALRVGTTVRLNGLGQRFENTYYVTATRHHYDEARGYQTSFEAECAYWGGQ